MRRNIVIPDRDELYDLYINQQWSTRKCAERFGMSQPWIRKFMREFGIPARPAKPLVSPMQGRHFSDEHRRHMSEARKRTNGMLGRIFEAHPNFVNGYRSYRRYLERGFLAPICVTCGATTKLVVHHINHNRKNNKLSNLKVLCTSCHKRYHLSHPYPPTNI